MIKINSTLSRLFFSTIRFPNNYQTIFELNRQIRGCLTLEDLSRCIEQHDTSIKQVGKTIILQQLNEFPLGSSKANSLSPLKVYLYVLTLDGLNLYEEQLRQACLTKMKEHSGHEGHKVSQLILQQQRHLISITKERPFDIVDAINWLVMHKNMSDSELVFHSFDVICTTDLQKYANIVSKLVSPLIRKIIYLEWFRVRQYRAIFEFLTTASDLHFKDSLQHQINICSKVASLRLQQLGYEQVPLLVSTLYTSVAPEMQNMTIRMIQTLLGMQAFVPFNTFASHQQQLFTTYLSKLEHEPPFVHLVPFGQLSKSDINALTSVYLKKWIGSKEIVFFLNRPQSEQFIYQSSFMTALLALFMRPPLKVAMAGDFSGYIMMAVRLLPYYKHQPDTTKKVLQHLKKVYNFFSNKYGQNTLIQNFSVCNLLHMAHLSQEGLLQVDIQFIRERLRKFLQRREQVTWRFKVSAEQLAESSHHYRQSLHKPILLLLDQVISGSVLASDFSYENGANTLFALQNSHTRNFFKNTILKLYQKMKDPLALADYYTLYSHKAPSLTTIIILKIWSIARSFGPAAKIVAHLDLWHLEHQGHLARGAANTFEQKAQYLTKEQLKQVSVGELTRVVTFVRCYHKDLPQFSIQFVKCLLNYMQEHGQTMLKSAAMQRLLLQTKYLLTALNLPEKAKTVETLATKAQLNASEPLSKLIFQMHFDQNKQAQSTRDQLETKINNEKYEIEQKTDILRLIKMIIQGKINVTSQGMNFLVKSAQVALNQGTLFPLQIKEQTQELFYCSADAPKPEESDLIRRLLFCSLQACQRQQGPDFYLWTLQLAHQYKDVRLIESALKHLSCHWLSAQTTIKVLSIMKEYPSVVDLQFVLQITNNVRIYFSHSRGTVTALLDYLKVIQKDLPAEIEQMRQQLAQDFSRYSAAKRKVFPLSQ